MRSGSGRSMSLAMPWAITASKAGGTSGRDGARGGGVFRCPLSCSSKAVAGVGTVSGQALVEHAGQRIHVGAAVRGSPETLGRHIGQVPIVCPVLVIAVSAAYARSQSRSGRRNLARW